MERLLKNRMFSLNAGLSSLGMLALAGFGHAQVADMLSAFDAGSRSSGAGGALTGASPDTLATYYNPAALAYIDRRTLNVVQKNLPNGRNSVVGKYYDQTKTTKNRSGNQAVTHVGFAVPMSSLRKGGIGTLAFSYTIGGYLEESSTGPTNSALELIPGLGVRNFTEKKSAKSEFYTLAYGRTNGAGNFAYGLGLTVVNQLMQLKQTGLLVDSGGNEINPGASPISFPNVRTNGTGLGLLAGVMFSPVNNPDLSVWASVRTPIQLNGVSKDAISYDRIPGRLIAGAAIRRDGYRKGAQDYLVLATQVTYYFSGSASQFYDRSSQSITSVGAEYYLVSGSAKIPLRVGYQAIGKGGRGFASRKGLTYGIGFQPGNGKYVLDLNYFQPSGGGGDTSITATYRF